jgi:hypothetical protein
MKTRRGEYYRLSTPEITDDYGGFTVDEFYVACEGGCDIDRWAFYDPDANTMLTTQTFPSYEDAVDAVPSVPDVLIVKFTVRMIGGSEDLEDDENDDG